MYGAPICELLEELIEFLYHKDDGGEIVFATLAHWTNFTTVAQYEGFIQMLTEVGLLSLLLTPYQIGGEKDYKSADFTAAIYETAIKDCHRVAMVWDMDLSDRNKDQIQKDFLAKPFKLNIPEFAEYGVATYKDFVEKFFWPSTFSPVGHGLGESVVAAEKAYDAGKHGIYGRYTDKTDVDSVIEQQSENFIHSLGFFRNEERVSVPAAVYFTLTPSTADMLGRIALAVARDKSQDVVNDVARAFGKQNGPQFGNATWMSLADLSDKINARLTHSFVTSPPFFNIGILQPRTANGPFLIYSDFYHRIPALLPACREITRKQIAARAKADDL